MMCLPGRVFVRLGRSPPSSRGKMDESAPETDRHWSMKGWSAKAFLHCAKDERCSPKPRRRRYS
jgi:hypothetical protein